MDKTLCPNFDPAHAHDPVMVAAHDLSHALACGAGAEIPYRELGELLRQDVSAGAPVPGEREIEVLAGNCEETEDSADIARVDALYPMTVARINAEF